MKRFWLGLIVALLASFGSLLPLRTAHADDAEIFGSYDFAEEGRPTLAEEAEQPATSEETDDTIYLTPQIDPAVEARYSTYFQPVDLADLQDQVYPAPVSLGETVERLARELATDLSAHPVAVAVNDLQSVLTPKIEGQLTWARQFADALAVNHELAQAEVADDASGELALDDTGFGDAEDGLIYDREFGYRSLTTESVAAPVVAAESAAVAPVDRMALLGLARVLDEAGSKLCELSRQLVEVVARAERADQAFQSRVQGETSAR